MWVALIVLAAVPPFENLFAPGARVEKVAGGFAFVEGPAFKKGQGLLFSDIPREQILLVGADDEIFVFREKSGGANGLMFDREGRLIACEGGARRVTRTEKDGSITVVAERFNGRRLNSPNDLAIDPKGRIFFTDPRYGRRDDMELDIEGVYRIDPDGKIARVIEDLVRPNGIVIARDGKTMWVADNGADLVQAYEIRADGSLAKLDRTAKMTGGPDGMTIDREGRLYATGPAGIWVFDPRGQLLGIIETPEHPANCAFGGAEDAVLYITARTSLYRVKLATSGAHPERTGG
ncbi:MAG: SMP-30/gluconolactonase/LRE family protein [Planctomycetes bacterium]|nr:SMP-30/gluconolactonase/LRE family protein [Planctomycetota bacterium]